MKRFVPVSIVLGLALLLGSLRGAAAEEDGPAAPPVADAEQAAVQRMVDELRPIVSALRGLPWKRKVPAELLTRDELRAFLQAQLDKDIDPQDLVRDTRIIHRLGILRPDQDPLSLQMSMMREMVAGAYDPQTKKLYLVRGFTGEGQKPTLVHELTHALDDQYHDLDALEKPYRDDDPDRQFAIRCLFEGSAEYARRAYEDAYPEAAQASFEQMTQNKELVAGQKRVLATVPTHMLLSMLLHYRAGPHFVTQAVGGDYPGGMRRIFEDPPTTEEQVLHPYKWLGDERDYPRRVVWGADFATVAGAAWKRLDEHSVGELDLAMYLDYFLGDAEGRLNEKTVAQGQFVSPLASRAAHGWDAGRATYLDGPDGHIVVIGAYAFDTEKDAAEAANILGAALRKANGEHWDGHGWQRPDGREEGPRTFDYAGRYGRGRIHQRGQEVLFVDGVPETLFATLWPAVAATSFERDPRDQGDTLADPFEGCAVVSRQRGLGLWLPGGTWQAEESERTPFSFADATNGEVLINFLVIDEEVTTGELPRVAKMVLGGVYQEDLVREAAVMGGRGLVHPMPAPPGRARRVYVASDAARTYVMIVGGSEAALKAADGEIQALLGGVRGPGPAAPTEGASRRTGLRSIPGY